MVMVVLLLVYKIRGKGIKRGGVVVEWRRGYLMIELWIKKRCGFAAAPVCTAA